VIVMSARWLSKLVRSNPAAEPCCSFCRKPHSEAGPFVEGPGIQGNGGVFICRSCVEFSQSIFEQDLAQFGTKTGPGSGEAAPPS
jgi:hypothetical protein